MPSNTCLGFDTTTGWTFFDLNDLHDEYHDVKTCIPDFDKARVVDSSVIRVKESVTHFSLGVIKIYFRQKRRLEYSKY